MDPAVPVRVKICGLRRLEDAMWAAAAGADLLGFILYPRAGRYISPPQVATITRSLREQCGTNCPRFVGVFVNENLAHVEQVMREAGLDLAQLHGAEPPEMVGTLGPRCYKALRLSLPEEAGPAIQAYGNGRQHLAPAFLVDSYHPQHYGGTGHLANWEAAAGLARTYHTLLAGGLNPENVAEAIRQVRPWGVDVSSGVEQSLGIKDRVKITEFIDNAKNQI
ncbi:MAG: phosphoribosylanthranilate isomerase [Chloroflexi bacterium]|nr:phosphoribosylanthranilate isomerase [Chloroflexota bacterium]